MQFSVIALITAIAGTTLAAPTDLERRVDCNSDSCQALVNEASCILDAGTNVIKILICLNDAGGVSNVSDFSPKTRPRVETKLISWDCLALPLHSLRPGPNWRVLVSARCLLNEIHRGHALKVASTRDRIREFARARNCWPAKLLIHLAQIHSLSATNRCNF